MDHDAAFLDDYDPAQDANPAAAAHRLVHAPERSERRLRRAGRLLLDHYGRRIMKWLPSRLGLGPADAEEVLIDAVHRFLQKIPRHCPAPEGWLMTAARRSAISRQRAERAGLRRPVGGFDFVGCPGDPGPLDRCAADADTSDPLHRLEARERSAAIPSLLKRLAARHSPRRADFLSLLMAGHDYAAIGATLGMSPGAVRDMAHRLQRSAPGWRGDRPEPPPDRPAD
jgi:DNA-directed RNA polymerase specialized sigma24 family protein